MIWKRNFWSQKTLSYLFFIHPHLNNIDTILVMWLHFHIFFATLTLCDISATNKKFANLSEPCFWSRAKPLLCSTKCVILYVLKSLEGIAIHITIHTKWSIAWSLYGPGIKELRFNYDITKAHILGCNLISEHNTHQIATNIGHRDHHTHRTQESTCKCVGLWFWWHKLR